MSDIIGQYLLYYIYMTNVYCSRALVYGYYIARFSLIFYYHSVFYSLGHVATIVMSYTTMVAPEWCFCQIRVKSDITIVAP